MYSVYAVHNYVTTLLGVRIGGVENNTNKPGCLLCRSRLREMVTTHTHPHPHTHSLTHTDTHTLLVPAILCWCQVGGDNSEPQNTCKIGQRSNGEDAGYQTRRVNDAMIQGCGLTCQKLEVGGQRFKVNWPATGDNSPGARHRAFCARAVVHRQNTANALPCGSR